VHHIFTVHEIFWGCNPVKGMGLLCNITWYYLMVYGLLYTGTWYTLMV